MARVTDPDLRSILPVRLRRLRLVRGLSQRAAAELAGVSKTALGRWEMGDCAPLRALLERYEAALARVPVQPALLDLPLEQGERTATKIVRIREALSESGLTPAKVAARAGRSPQWVTNKLYHFCACDLEYVEVMRTIARLKEEAGE